MSADFWFGVVVGLIGGSAMGMIWFARWVRIRIYSAFPSTKLGRHLAVSEKNTP